MLVVQVLVLLNIALAIVGSFPLLVTTARFTDIQEQMGSTVNYEIDTRNARAVYRKSPKRH